MACKMYYKCQRCGQLFDGFPDYHINNPTEYGVEDNRAFGLLSRHKCSDGEVGDGKFRILRCDWKKDDEYKNDLYTLKKISETENVKVFLNVDSEAIISINREIDGLLQHRVLSISQYEIILSLLKVFDLYTDDLRGYALSILDKETCDENLKNYL